jgi:small subunit ribosomal protein S9
MTKERETMSVQYYEGVGRRKESTARVRVMSGSGRFIVNGKEAPAYFARFGDLQEILTPLAVVGQDLARLDISVKVKGGGVSGQTGAVKLGLARALLAMNPEWRPILRQYGLLTRDPRVKERKKPGLKRARKAPTYTKR